MTARLYIFMRYGLLLCGIVALFPLLASVSAARNNGVSSTDAGSQPGDWPTYMHDAQRTSFNPDETTIMTTNVSLLAAHWQGEIGIGSRDNPAYNAPSVANGKVFVASSTDTGNNFFSFDENTGALDWSQFVGFNPNECFGIGVGSTAAISGTVLTVGGGDGAYYGLDANSGTQLWRHALNVQPPGFAWTSPLFANNRVYVGISTDCGAPTSTRSEVRALDPVTGQQLANAYLVPEGHVGGDLWQSPVLSPDGSKVIIATGNDDQQYNGMYTRAIVVLDANTLQILDSNQQGGFNIDQDWVTTPIVFHDNTGRTLVGAGLKFDKFYAYDLSNVGAGPVWSWQPGLDSSNPGAYDPTFGDGGTLIFNTHQRLYAVDPATGHARWPDVFVGETHGSIAVANGLIYLNKIGTLEIVNEANGDLLRSITPANHGIAYDGPVISHGVIYWTSGGYINAWGLPLPTPTATTTPPTPTDTATPTMTPTPIPPPCAGERFTDVCPPDYFYNPVIALNNDGIVAGYNTSPPCLNSLWIPCFNPYNTASRGQISKLMSLAAGFEDIVPGQSFQDVLPGSTFYTYTEQLAERDIVDGYPCGGDGEPCVPPGNLPYFRSSNTVTRGQMTKLAANTFGWSEDVTGQQFEDVLPGSTFYSYIARLYNRGIISGYPCNTLNLPCVPPGNLPYFLPAVEVTRGQSAKIVQNSRTQPTSTPTPTSTSTATATSTDTATPATTDTPEPTLTITASVTSTSTPFLGVRPTFTPTPTSQAGNPDLH